MSDLAPEVVVLPGGTLLLGSPDDEPSRLPVEGPQQPITFARPFAIGRFAVTLDQFAAFATETGFPVAPTCKQWNGTDWQDRPGSFLSPGFAQTGAHPVVGVSWDDAGAYVGWLAARTGRRFRLPTEAEWEYAARAGTATPYWWGASFAPSQANCRPDAGADPDAKGGLWRQTTVPVDGFAPNPWGLYQMHGNAWEWVEDCWHPSHAGAPDGRARPGPPSSKRVVRGGSWLNRSRGLRSARRHAADRGNRRADIGFRVAEDVESKA